VRVSVIPGGTPLAADWLERRFGRYLGPLQGLTFESWHPILILETPVIRTGEPFRVRAAHDLVGVCRLFAELMAALLVLDMWRAAWFLIRGQRINRRLLQPIAEITAHAQMLSENDLSLRLNVAGAKNELKDLATVFNAMLDRIEAAYNGQKQFVSDASHELRTPIAVIQGYANLLERWGKNDPQVRDESIAAIINETAGMKDLVEKLLFLARHDKTAFKLTLEHFDLRELMEETVRETEMITVNHRVETGALGGGILYADRNAIKQAIRVFIDNAVKYTPTGGVIRLASERVPGAVIITISDTGQGIARADLAKIFDRFYRADAARSSVVGGHGLGLAIARIIVASHGGKIQVRSQKGVGSTFRIVLPN
jgi:signal transduction histidine kinase